MLTHHQNPYALTITEAVGLAHERQVVEVPAPPGNEALLELREAQTGARFPMQRSRLDPKRGFLLLHVRPLSKLTLTASTPVASSQQPVAGEKEKDGRPTLVVESQEQGAKSISLTNGRFAVRVAFGEQTFTPDNAPLFPFGPILKVRREGGPWRGNTFFDTRERMRSWRGELIESGPIRSVYRYRAEFAGDGWYELDLTVDSGAVFARIEERYRCGTGDQLVWDFSGDDLPDEMHLLDPGPAFTKRKPHYHFDQRQARLAPWTQQQQLSDFSDGYALVFNGGEDLAGFVALEGGAWRGNRLCHLEAWTRRWIGSDPETRRNVTWEAKADSNPHPEKIPARGEPICTPHFCLEGWIGATTCQQSEVSDQKSEGPSSSSQQLVTSSQFGLRRYALVLTTLRESLPPALVEVDVEQHGRGCLPQANHFERTPERERYRREQGLLRRIQIQHGVMPLQAQLGMSFVWPNESRPEQGFRYPCPLLERHLNWQDPHQAVDEVKRLADFREYLEARVYGFWESGGIAYTNPVSSRAVAPRMFYLEWLGATGGQNRSCQAPGPDARPCSEAQSAGDQTTGGEHGQALWLGVQGVRANPPVAPVTPEELALRRAQFAFLSHLFASENYYTGRASMMPLEDPDSTEPTMEGMANQNFYTDVINVFGTAAQVFSNHPSATEWRERFAELLHRQLEYHMYPESGVWEESHTYYHHVLHTILPTLLRRRDDGVADEFARADLQKLVGAALKYLSPRDASYDGCRHTVALGDHSPEVKHYRYIYAGFARAFQKHNPKLAGQLAWAYREMQGPEELAAESIAPAWRSEYVQGLGVFFRNVDAEGCESLLALRTGSSWGHHHNDDGSVQFFAKGRALVVDAAFGGVQENGDRKHGVAGHSRWGLRGIETQNWPYRFNRGWLVRHSFEGPFPHALIYQPAFLYHSGVKRELLPTGVEHHRLVVQLSPTAFLIADFNECRRPQTLYFHVPGSGVETNEQGVCARYDDTRLWILPLQPHPFRLRTRQDRPVSDRKTPSPAQFQTTALEFDLKDGCPALTLVVADTPGDAAPVVDRQNDLWRIQHASGSLKVSLPAGTLTIESDQGERVAF